MNIQNSFARQKEFRGNDDAVGLLAMDEDGDDGPGLPARVLFCSGAMLVCRRISFSKRKTEQAGPMKSAARQNAAFGLDNDLATDRPKDVLLAPARLRPAK